MKFVDYPMACCGMVEVSGINLTGYVADLSVEGGWRRPDEREWKPFFDKIEDHQKKHRRNCAMVVLVSSYSRKYAEMFGWKKVFEFYNPNSGNHCHIYTKVLWATSQAYFNAMKAGYPAPERDDWLYRQDVYELDPAKGYARVEVESE